MKIKEATIERLIGTICLHKARCINHMGDKEPSRVNTQLISLGYHALYELNERLKPEDWEWYKMLFKRVDAVSSKE